jgi:hypothetical protein
MFPPAKDQDYRRLLDAVNGIERQMFVFTKGTERWCRMRGIDLGNLRTALLRHFRNRCSVYEKRVQRRTFAQHFEANLALFSGMDEDEDPNSEAYLELVLNARGLLAITVHSHNNSYRLPRHCEGEA